MRHLGVRPPDPPAGETDVKTTSEILPHERFAMDARAPVEVHRVERNSMKPETVERPQETVAADEHPGPLPEAAAPLPDPVSLPHERDALEQREPVQVYRLEPTPMKARPAERPRERVAADPYPGPPREAARRRADPVPFPEATGRAPIGRWEEFHEFRNTEPKRGRGRLHLEPTPMGQGPSSKLLTADLDRERRSSSFLTIAVLAIAALLAAGAILWSGALRYRVRQQDAAMSALQERNRKLAESLAQMNREQVSAEQMSGEQKAPGTLDSSEDAPQNPAAAPAPASASEEGSKAAAQPEKVRPSKQQPQKRQGVSVPPPVPQRGHVSAHQKGSRSADAGYSPEIVPPYPTTFKSENVAVNAANSQPVPDAGAYHPPFTPGAPIASGANRQPAPGVGSDRSAATAVTTPRAGVPQASAASRLPTQQPAKTSMPAVPAPEGTAAESATPYTANGNGAYASPLAQNIEAVEGLQRHSPVQLKEFHARAGTSTKATPNVRLSVQQPDQGRGSYALVVNEGGASRQLRGQVNRPLVFTDTATHREYALVILSIADQQVYGYVRAAQ